MFILRDARLKEEHDTLESAWQAGWTWWRRHYDRDATAVEGKSEQAPAVPGSIEEANLALGARGAAMLSGWGFSGMAATLRISERRERDPNAVAAILELSKRPKPPNFLEPVLARPEPPKEEP